jgi:hypothetical protein
VQRASDRNGPRRDDELESELSDTPGAGGGHREERADPEPPADDDPPRPGVGTDPVAEQAAADTERLARLRHDLAVANDGGEDPLCPGRER